MDVDFKIIKTKCMEIANTIQKKESDLIEALILYEPYNVAKYEIERCIRTLKIIDENQEYFKKKVATVSVFMPSNLPLYSLIIFVVIPGFISEKLYVHPNDALRRLSIIQKLWESLELEEHMPNIVITSEGHDVFVEKYVQRSKVIIFTGRGTTKAKIENIMPEDSILIFNGAGHNPIVVSEDADVDKAAEDSVFVKFFNSGQDCAGPDSILVHKKISSEFIEKFTTKCSKLIVDKFSNKKAFVGPVHQESELKRLEKIISDNKDDVVYGGKTDFRNSIAHPTIIFSKITEKVNFKETFGPLAFIVEYEEDEQLKIYFQDKDGKYQFNKMYVSLYGNSQYIRSNCDVILLKDNNNTKNGTGIVLNNQTIHDVEIGTKAYGGYSKGASAVVYKNSRGEISKCALPILIPQIITELLINKQSINNLQIPTSSILKNISDSDKDFVLKIEYEFKQQVNRIFGNNVEFAFIFGSIANRTFRKGESDIDTFICLKTADELNKINFTNWLVQLQYNINLKPDLEYPSEIVTYNMLESAVTNLEEIKISFSYCQQDSTIFDRIFWVCILSSYHKKKAFVGGEEGGRKLCSLAQKCKSYPKKWGEDFIQLFDNSAGIPISLKRSCKHLNKKDIKQKLTKLFEEHEFCEIMRLIEFNADKRAFNQTCTKNQLRTLSTGSNGLANSHFKSLRNVSYSL